MEKRTKINGEYSECVGNHCSSQIYSASAFQKRGGGVKSNTNEVNQESARFKNTPENERRKSRKVTKKVQTNKENKKKMHQATEDMNENNEPSEKETTLRANRRRKSK